MALDGPQQHAAGQRGEQYRDHRHRDALPSSRLAAGRDLAHAPFPFTANAFGRARASTAPSVGMPSVGVDLERCRRPRAPVPGSRRARPSPPDSTAIRWPTRRTVASLAPTISWQTPENHDISTVPSPASASWTTMSSGACVAAALRATSCRSMALKAPRPTVLQPGLGPRVGLGQRVEPGLGLVECLVHRVTGPPGAARLRHEDRAEVLPDGELVLVAAGGRYDAYLLADRARSPPAARTRAPPAVRRPACASPPGPDQRGAPPRVVVLDGRYPPDRDPQVDRDRTLGGLQERRLGPHGDAAVGLFPLDLLDVTDQGGPSTSMCGSARSSRFAASTTPCFPSSASTAGTRVIRTRKASTNTPDRQTEGDRLDRRASRPG